MIKEPTTTLTPPSSGTSLLTDQDLHLFNEGTHYRIYNKLGAHLNTIAGQPGTSFAVWVPNARKISVVQAASIAGIQSLTPSRLVAIPAFGRISFPE